MPAHHMYSYPHKHVPLTMQTTKTGSRKLNAGESVLEAQIRLPQMPHFHHIVSHHRANKSALGGGRRVAI